MTSILSVSIRPAFAAQPSSDPFALLPPDLSEHPVFPLLVVLAVCLLQASLIVVLLIQRRRIRQAQQAWRRSEDKYRFIVEWAQEGICTVDTSGVYSYVNQFMGNLLGYPVADVVGRKVSEFIASADLPVYRTQVDAVKQGVCVQFEVRYQGAPGHSGWILVSATPLRDCSGQVTGFFAMVHDQTARKHSEQAWKESEERYQMLIQQAPEAILVYDIDLGHYVDANLHAQNLFGLSHDELCCSSPDKLYQEEQPDGKPPLESITENVRRVLAGETLVLERAVKDTRGRYFPCELRLSMLPSANRRLIWGSYIDITARKKAENALRLSEQRFKSIFEQAADGIIVFEECGTISGFNTAVLDLLAYDAGELAGMRYRDLLEPGQLERSPLDLDALRKGVIVRTERVFRRKDGRQIYADVSGSMTDGGFFQVMIKDVSTRKELEKLREDVDRIMRHDLKTPLVGIQGLARLLLKEELTEKGAERLGLLADSADRMMRMIAMSLDLYKMETNTYEHTPAPFDLLRTVRQVIAQVQPIVRPRQVEFSVTLGAGPPDTDDTFTVYGEEHLCMGMLENLVQNAVEASPKGGEVHICLDAVRQRIAIVNQGEVPVGIREKFFEKYVTSGKNWGTGLGTYSAKLVAGVHRWAISLDCSTQGQTEVRIDMRPAHSD